MHNTRIPFPFSPVPVCFGIVGILLVVYIGLIAVVISYAALTIEFSQSVKNDEAALAALESQYLADVSKITDTDYAALGYAKPTAQLFVRGATVTALR